ncbi:MAG: RNA-directed DNA polymerase, partial [Caulobacterales bacterium]
YEANYTRYADDLTFSGGSRLSARIDSFLDVVTVIVEDEGYSLNAQKTRVMRKSSRQQVTGIIVNDWINVERRTYDALKATLYNCVKHGPNSQSRSSHSNFRAHLEGRISWIEALNPNKGARLRTLFEKIKWPQADS